MAAPTPTRFPSIPPIHLKLETCNPKPRQSRNLIPQIRHVNASRASLVLSSFYVVPTTSLSLAPDMAEQLQLVAWREGGKASVCLSAEKRSGQASIQINL